MINFIAYTCTCRSTTILICIYKYLYIYIYISYTYLGHPMYAKFLPFGGILPFQPKGKKLLSSDFHGFHTFLANGWLKPNWSKLNRIFFPWMPLSSCNLRVSVLCTPFFTLATTFNPMSNHPAPLCSCDVRIPGVEIIEGAARWFGGRVLVRDKFLVIFLDLALPTVITTGFGPKNQLSILWFWSWRLSQHPSQLQHQQLQCHP